MSKKSHPESIRCGTVKGWNKFIGFHHKNYIEYLAENKKIREFLEKNLSRTSYSHIKIEKIGKRKTIVTVFTHRPMVFVGRKGEEIKKLQDSLSKYMEKDIDVSIAQVVDHETDAAIICKEIAQHIADRKDYRRYVRMIMRNAKSKVEGMMIKVAGRLGGSSIARSDTQRMGRVPLQTISKMIDYHSEDAQTVYGTCGVKVYVNKMRGEYGRANTKEAKI